MNPTTVSSAGKNWPMEVAALLVGLSMACLRGALYWHDLDGYLAMQHAQEGLGAYLKFHHTTFGNTVLAWILHRLAGDIIRGFGLFCAGSVVATFLLLYHQLRARPGFPCLWVLALVALNGGIFIFTHNNSEYVSSVFAGAWFLLLLRDLGTPVERKASRVIVLSLIGAVVAFFTKITLIPPACVGILILLVYSWRRLFSRLFLYRALPLAVFPLVQTTLFLIKPFKNLGKDARPDMAAGFLGTSGFDPDLGGAISFLKERFSHTFSSLLNLRSPLHGWPSAALTALLFVIVLGMTSRRVRTWMEAETQLVVCVWFVVLTSVAVSVASLFGFFPFDARYLSVLLAPSCIILGSFLSRLAAHVVPESGLPKRLALVLAVLILAGGVGKGVREYRHLRTSNDRREAVVRQAISWPADLVLYSQYNYYEFVIRFPGLIRNGCSMGWGKFWAGNQDLPVPSAISEKLRGKRSVLVITSYDFLEQYRHWGELLERTFVPVREVREGAFHAMLFARKGEEIRD